MNYYLTTDENDISFPNRKWTNDIEYEESNSNYIFFLYKDLNVAKFITPTLEAYNNPHFWIVTPNDKYNSGIIRDSFTKCKAINAVDSTMPTTEQYFNFAALLCANYIKNKDFMSWMIKYLKNEDRSTATIVNLSEKFLCLDENLPLDETYIAPCHAMLKAVMNENNSKYFSHSAYKMICDAPDTLDINSFAHAAINLKTEEIIKLIEDNI